MGVTERRGGGGLKIKQTRKYCFNPRGESINIYNNILYISDGEIGDKITRKRKYNFLFYGR